MSSIDQRITTLEAHLERENPLLLDVVRCFRNLDKVAYDLGILPRDDSFATQVPWWPLVTVLGTFSSGKSSFINHLLQSPLQTTGNQAVDDKFTVICFGADDRSRTLPGVALDSDPRFPFYKVSHDIEKVSQGEGRRIDAYLQLKTCKSETLRGKILIDSPGFDADAQRTATLQITDHIINLSDLVLVFFDARHPEPGAMPDTLKHLVSDTIKRPDSNKFLYILNQIDTAAKEDNAEDVFAAWQRALAQAGLTAGRFYCTYNPEVAQPIEDAEVRKRFESKCKEDVFDIRQRIQQVGIERLYRIIGALEKTAKDIEEQAVPAIAAAKASWKRLVLWSEGIVLGLLVIAFLLWTIPAGYWGGGALFSAPWFDPLIANRWIAGILLILIAGAGIYAHFFIRKIAARFVLRGLSRNKERHERLKGWVARAFEHNTRAWRSIFVQSPAGWNRRARNRIADIVAQADRFVQKINDRFADPSGASAKPAIERGESPKDDGDISDRRKAGIDPAPAMTAATEPAAPSIPADGPAEKASQEKPFTGSVVEKG
ncbi:MAG: dynamin family protein [Ectothiorhodospiraceae bacterium AqS1]|nr:dynamin family protein [Ectothiorhodospiraceae bacterium AqS1]